MNTEEKKSESAKNALLGKGLGRGAIGSHKWLAAAIDFEGTIGLYQHKSKQGKGGWTWRCKFIISGTNKELITKVKELCGMGYMTGAKKNGNNPNWKPLYIFN